MNESLHKQFIEQKNLEKKKLKTKPIPYYP